MGKRTPWWIKEGVPNPNQDPKVRKKISNANKGKIPWNKNKKGLFTGETLEKMSKRAEERWKNPEYRKKVCAAFKRRTPWNKGKKGVMPEPWSTGKKGMFPKETLEKMSRSHMGRTPWNKGKSPSEETKKKISETLRGKLEGKNNPHYGKHHSKETRRKLSELAKERLKNPRNHPMYGKHLSQEAIEKIKEARKHQKLPESPTTPEIKFMNICEKYGLPYEYTGDGKVWIGGLNPDFIDPENKRIIEIFGDYWHDPHRREIPFWSTEWGRKKTIGQYGYNVLVIWEHELEDEHPVLEKLARFINE